MIEYVNIKLDRLALLIRQDAYSDKIPRIAFVLAIGARKDHDNRSFCHDNSFPSAFYDRDQRNY